MLALSIHYSEATSNMLTNDIDEQISNWSVYYNLDENVVRAIIQTESSFQPWAIRLEPHLKKTNWYIKAVPARHRSNDYAYCSMGLMQVMYGIAVADHDFAGEPMDLMAPSNAIQYGCKHLAWMKKRFPDGYDYISAYNQGNNRRISNGEYKNQQYVNKVIKHLSEIEAQEED